MLTDFVKGDNFTFNALGSPVCIWCHNLGDGSRSLLGGVTIKQQCACATRQNIVQGCGHFIGHGENCLCHDVGQTWHHWRRQSRIRVHHRSDYRRIRSKAMSEMGIKTSGNLRFFESASAVQFEVFGLTPLALVLQLQCTQDIKSSVNCVLSHFAIRCEFSASDRDDA